MPWIKENWKNVCLLFCLICGSLFLFSRLALAGTSTSTGSTTVSGNYPNPGGCSGCGGGDDVTAPAAITDLSIVGVTDSSATLRWTSPGDDANTGTATSYDLRYSTTNLSNAGAWDVASQASGEPAPLSAGNSQTFSVSGLSANTTYYFALKTSDEVPNTSAISNIVSTTTLSGITPDTAPPIISDIQVSNITGESARITWLTNEAATSTVVYGLTTSYELGKVVDDNFVTSHVINLNNLQSEKIYYFKVKSADVSHNEAVSDERNFTTVDVTPPVISNIQVSKQVISATITWDTNEASDSQIAYGKNISLGSLSSNSNNVTHHSLTVSPLQGATKYYFVVRSTDATGNQGSSEMDFFITNSDINPPANVSGLSALAGNEQVTLSWQNPADADFEGVMIRRSTTGFPSSPAVGTLVDRVSGSNKTDTGLTNGVLYYYAVFAYDTSENFSSGALVNATPVAEGQPPPPPPPPPPFPPGGGETVFYLSDFIFTAAKGKIEVPPKATMNFLPGTAFGVAISGGKMPKGVESIILSVNKELYLFKFEAVKNEWSSEVSLPAAVNQYPAEIVIKFQDQTVAKMNWQIAVLPFGQIYETKGQVLPIAGAKVSLLTSPTLWPAEAYGEQNPQITNANGEFGYLVPPGKYILKVEKEGYETREIGYFESNGIVINNEVELLAVPPKLKDVINPEASLTENIGNIAKNLGQKTVFVSKLAGQLVVTPVVKETTRDVAAPIVAGAVAVSATTTIGASQLLLYLRFLFTQPILFFFRRKRRGWGVVYNSLTKMPLDLVTVRLIDTATNRIVQSKVTDKSGRYAFLPLPGKYLIDIKLDNFIFPTVFLNTLKEDKTFVDIYHGEAIEVKEKGAVLTPNIPLDPAGEEKPIGKILWQLALRRLQNALSIVSLVLAVAFVVIIPGMMTGILLAVQILFYLLFLRLAHPSRPKSWGIVYNNYNKKPLEKTVVRIFDTQYNKLLETQVTDQKGRYSFLVGRNKYYMIYDKSGFEKKQSEPIDLLGNSEPTASLGIDVGLHPNLPPGPEIRKEEPPAPTNPPALEGPSVGEKAALPSAEKTAEESPKDAPPPPTS